MAESRQNAFFVASAVGVFRADVSTRGRTKTNNITSNANIAYKRETQRSTCEFLGRSHGPRVYRVRHDRTVQRIRASLAVTAWWRIAGTDRRKYEYRRDLRNVTRGVHMLSYTGKTWHAFTWYGSTLYALRPTRRSTGRFTRSNQHGGSKITRIRAHQTRMRLVCFRRTRFVNWTIRYYYTGIFTALLV